MRVMEEINIRIKEYVAARKLNGTSLARELDFSPVSVNQWLSGKRKVSWEFVQAILNNDEKLSSDWLTRGRGEMYESGTNSNESSTQITRELADAKVKMVVQEGIIDKLLKVIGGKIEDRQKFVVEKHESNVG